MKSPFHTSQSDGLSFCVTPVELLFEGSRFGHGTGFIWKHAERFYLVTNWHNFAGHNPFDESHLNPGGRIPDRVRIQPCTITNRMDGTSEIKRNVLELPLYEFFDIPYWIQHETFHVTRADVAALVLPQGDLSYSHVNQYNYQPLYTNLGADLLIVGYPFSEWEGLALPIWKRGSLASEPIFGWQDRPAFLIDAASRPGMSGSPVFRRVFGPSASADSNGRYIIKADNVMTSEFVGVYAGHLIAHSSEVTIGFAWYGTLISEMLDNPGVGARL
jgi:hypothetical protein